MLLITLFSDAFFLQMMTNQRNVLLIAYDEHLILSFLYCLRKQKGFNYYLLTHKPKSSAGHSRYIKGLRYYKDYSDLETVIPQCLKEWSIDLLMPIGEKESLEVSRHRDTFEKLCKVMPLTDPKHFEIATNKKALNRFLLDRDLHLMSATLELDDPQFNQKLDGFPFPGLVKPAQGAFGSGITTVKDRRELESFLEKENPEPSHYYLQEYISGSDINCIVVCQDGDVKHWSVQESPAKEIGNYNKNDDLIFRPAPEVLEVVKPMLKALNYQGVACIDLRRDTAKNKVFLLEINARFWGSMMASLLRANVNFPLIMLKLTAGETPPQYQKKEGKQISTSTFIRDTLRFKFPRISQLKFWPYLNDPMARIMKYWNQRF